MKKLFLNSFSWLHLLVLPFMLGGCESNSGASEDSEMKAISKTGIVYGLNDDALGILADRLGFHLEALGMSGYSFTRGDLQFDVSAPVDWGSTDRVRAAGPIVLTDYTERSRNKPPLYIRITVAQGVTIDYVEGRFRNFVGKMIQRD